MLKKEFYDALKIFLECMVLLIGVPIGLVMDKFIIHFGWKLSEIFNFVFLITLAIYSIASGLTIFQSEKKDRAFEYLLSLPLSKFKIIMYKIFPRFLFLLLLIIASVFFSIFNNIWINGFSLIVVFFFSLFISISVNSIVIGLIGISLLFSVYYQASRIIHIIFLGWNLEKLSPFSTGALLSDIFTAAILLTPLGMAFWITFKKFDVKPLKLQLRAYLSIILPTILIFVSFVVLFYKKLISLAGG